MNSVKIEPYAMLELVKIDGFTKRDLVLLFSVSCMAHGTFRNRPSGFFGFFPFSINHKKKIQTMTGYKYLGLKNSLSKLVKMNICKQATKDLYMLNPRLINNMRYQKDFSGSFKWDYAKSCLFYDNIQLNKIKLVSR